jgi:hypothetical protein
VIVTAGPAGDGVAEAEVPPAALPAGETDPLAPGFPLLVAVLPVQAASVATSAPTARAETTLIALMPTL